MPSRGRPNRPDAPPTRTHQLISVSGPGGLARQAIPGKCAVGDPRPAAVRAVPAPGAIPTSYSPA